MSDMISKRLVLALAGAVLLASPLAATAQQPKPTPKPKVITPAREVSPSSDVKKTPPAAPTGDTKQTTPITAPAATQKTAKAPTGAAAPAATAAAKPWSVKITKKAPVSLTLSSKNGRLTEIAAEISQRLKTPVILTPLMQQQN
ncbi:MAG TPA: hypothetical protein VEQ40_11375, partial [Pyrinomonadaceae bacterium]|nr:hypothetical protein [Pyrinomonadaceae bacterium]